MSILHPPNPVTDVVPVPDGFTPEHRPHWRRDVALFLSGQTVSMLGSMLAQMAVMWHLTLESNSGAVMALAMVFGFVPQAVVSIFGGVWADRINRKFLIIAADATIALATLALALLLLVGFEGFWLFYLTLAIRSAGAGIQGPAVSALIPQITPTTQLVRVNGLMGSVMTVMSLLAPAVGGVLYATTPLGVIFMIDVGTAVIGISLVAWIPVKAIRRWGTQEKPGYFSDLAAGARYTFSHRFVRWLLGVYGAVFLLTFVPTSLTVLMVTRTFGSEVWKLAANELAWGAGMLLGGLVIAALNIRRRRVVLVLIAGLAFGALSVALGLSTNLWVFLGITALFGAVLPFFFNLSTTLFQERVEPALHGRVFGFAGMVTAFAMPLGMAVFGPLADHVKIEWLLIVGGAATFVVILVAILVPSGRRAIREDRPVIAAIRPDGALAADGSGSRGEAQRHNRRPHTASASADSNALTNAVNISRSRSGDA